MIQHDDRAPAGLQHTMNFAHRRLDVRRVMQNAVRVNQIKRRTGKVETLGISNAKLTFQAGHLETFARQLDGGISQINARIIRTSLSELRAVGAHPAANLQYMQTARLR